MPKTDLMGQLLASLKNKPLKLYRGQQVEGRLVAILAQELVLDLDIKAEGILSKKDISAELLSKLKIGDKISAYVLIPETQSGQAILSTQRTQTNLKTAVFNKKWDKFIQAQNQKRILKGSGVEVNKGGVIVEVDGTRGFLPISQVIYTKISDLESLIGEDIEVQVIEVDPQNNRLIFTQRKEVSKALLDKLSEYSVDQNVIGKVAAVLPFGVYLEVNGVEGLVRTSDLNRLYQIDQMVEAEVMSIDKNLGRLNLSVKNSHKFKVDDVVQGTVTRVNNIGVFVSLSGGASGLMHISTLEPGALYQEGQEVTCLVDSVDLERRRINLTPFITSTKGLIYK